LCLEGVEQSTGNDVIMPRGQWEDTSGLESYKLRVAVSKCENCELILESSLNPDVSAADTNTWAAVIDAVAAVQDEAYLVSNASEISEHTGGGVLRWRIKPTGGALGRWWRICFQVRMMEG
jgi:hypothetical protein